MFLAGAAVTFALRLGEHRALAKETEALAVPNVVVVQPKPEPAQQDLTLPSSLQAFTESPIYARTNGYVARWYKDIGSQIWKPPKSIRNCCRRALPAARPKHR